MRHNRRKNKDGTRSHRQRIGTGYPVGTVVSSNSRKYVVQPDGSWRVMSYEDAPVSSSDIYFTHPEAHKMNIASIMKGMEARQAELNETEPSGGDNAGLA